MACVKDISNRVIKVLKEPHNNILSSYEKTGLCNYSVSREEQMELVTEKEKETAETKAQKDANSSKQERLAQTLETRLYTNTEEKGACK